MSYKFSRGYQIIGDLSGSDDAQRDTGIDFEDNYIGLQTSGSTVFAVSGSKVGVGLTNPSHKLDINGDIRVRGNDIRDNSGNPAVSFDGSANTTINGTLTVNDYTFPATDGNPDQVLQTNGSGQLSFVDVSGGGGGGSSNSVVVYGSMILQKNGSRTISFDRTTSLGGTAYSNKKGMIFAPFNGTVSKIIVSLKDTVTTARQGTITLKIFKNANAYGSSAFSEDKVGDNFTQVVSSGNPLNAKGTFSPNLSINEGDLLQFTVGRDNSGNQGGADGIVTIVMTES